jgi:tetratricopeptide (TPR) repeat protein
MHSTDQYRVFPNVPADRALSRPRRLLSEGRLEEAQHAYRAVLGIEPDLKAAWLEYFSLLRQTGRHADALALASEAAAQFGVQALPLALKGAALVELGRFREGLAALDEAARLDPDLGLIWHEAGYAAWRLGELSRALMALDRAFALEPHSGTLHLRGKVLRQAGRYLAAEVAFEGAAEAAEFPVQRDAAAREIRVTRRFAAFPGSRPDTLPPAQRWFAQEGAVALTGRQGPPAAEGQIARALVPLARELGWRFTVVVALDAWQGWYDLARDLGAPVAAELPADAAAIPLLVSRHPDGGPRWREAAERIAAGGRGASFALRQDPETPPADLCGWIGDAAMGAPDLGFATEACRHPEARLSSRTLH